MQNVSFDEIVERIVDTDRRFQPGAYEFLREALDFTQQQAASDGIEVQRHVTGQQLLEGIREFALREFGPMAMTVFNAWGVTRCEDFGDIVFNLIEHQVLKKTERDSRADFKGGYDFEAAFCHPFLPASRRSVPAAASTSTSRLSPD
jgi:uncharacterized repeat protein (TIGR04138 family)